MSQVLTTGELLIDFSPVNIEGYPSMFCPNPGGAPANAAVQLAAKWAKMTLASP